MKILKFILLGGSLALQTCAANADPLPSAYLGRWCGVLGGEGKYVLAETEKEWRTCRDRGPDGDGYVEITRDGFEDCKFVSIKHMGTKMSVPPVLIAARCVGGTGLLRLIYKYRTGGLLSIEQDPRHPVNDCFTPEIGHRSAQLARQKSAKS